MNRVNSEDFKFVIFKPTGGPDAEKSERGGNLNQNL